jgi:hypothetical protein
MRIANLLVCLSTCLDRAAIARSSTHPQGLSELFFRPASATLSKILRKRKRFFVTNEQAFSKDPKQKITDLRIYDLHPHFFCSSPSIAHKEFYTTGKDLVPIWTA